jgi:hypothetical protein
MLARPAPQHSRKHKEQEDARDEQPCAARPALDQRPLAAERRAQQAEDQCPEHAASRVEEQEAPVGHVVDPRQERAPRPQDGGEASEEDGFVAVAHIERNAEGSHHEAESPAAMISPRQWAPSNIYSTMCTGK